ncbi:MAG: hypothetical protein KDJ46_10365 [Rhodobiaceae bacterium]|nr:hypothetical protein [Rhodobiaceae bacterium]
MAFLVVIMALDLVAFGGRYSARGWHIAQQTGLDFHFEIARTIARLGS